MKRIAVLTSGGDAPGMNAAIRAVVRTGLDKGWEVFGIRRGYVGLIAGRVGPLGARDVGGIIQQGGTMLGSARCPEFKTEDGRLKALRQLHQHDVDDLVIIGGNGSQAGAYALSQMGFPVVGVASTIDNDLYGSDITIGVDTALDVALEAIDRLKVTAASHQRAFLVEVMGRDCGYLALMSGIAGGAEIVVIPEFDRLLATRLGAVATEHLARGQHGLLVGLLKGEIAATPLAEVIANEKPLDLRLLELAQVLAE
ncbi:MAG: ATP-dependent 6-phosphofructokinase [Anaerolineae bacterium]